MSELFTHHTAPINGFRMHYVTAGTGYPLVFVHGWPQSWYEWRKIIPALAERFTIIAPDLRGLGDSGRPLTGYDKRTLASDVHALVRSLGYETIGLTGHDWGGAVAYYLAYDHPDMVKRLMILDMVPGLGRTGETMDLRTAQRFWHVFFHAGLPDLAERLVSSSIRAYLSHFYTSPDYNYRPTVFSKEDIDEYVRVYSAPGALRSGFQYYATGLNEDLDNLKSCTEKLKMPVLVWGGERFMANIVSIWQGVAENVQGGLIAECGHFIAEEQPEFVIQQALEFFEPLQSEA